jgi:hypothetical protein
MAGALGDVFEITGRGTVVILKDFDNSVKIGDQIAIGHHKWVVKGNELPGRPIDLNNIPPRRPVGVLLADATKAELLPLVGQPITVIKAGTS